MALSSRTHRSTADLIRSSTASGAGPYQNSVGQGRMGYVATSGRQCEGMDRGASFRNCSLREYYHGGARLTDERDPLDTKIRNSQRGEMGSTNRLKLGLFGANCSSGRAVTIVPERWSGSWPDCVKLAEMADRAGIEFMLPIGRWKGYGGETDYQGATWETVAWACGLLTIRVLKTAVRAAKLGQEEELGALKRLDEQARLLERYASGSSVEELIVHEREQSHSYGGRSVFGSASPPATRAPITSGRIITPTNASG